MVRITIAVRKYIKALCRLCSFMIIAVFVTDFVSAPPAYGFSISSNSSKSAIRGTVIDIEEETFDVNVKGRIIEVLTKDLDVDHVKRLQVGDKVRLTGRFKDAKFNAKKMKIEFD